MAKFYQIRAKFRHLWMLESDRFFEYTENALSDAAKSLDIDISDDEISAIAQSELFSRYSKNPNLHYNAQMRRAVQAKVLAAFGSEIDEGMQWGARLME